METLENPLSHEPRYRINAVSEMTGLSAPNLRAWERRYGIPNPQRGENAYRLYSNRDITLLRKMKALCDDGHAPSDAAKLTLSTLEFDEGEDQVLIGLESAQSALIKAARDFKPFEVENILNQLPSLGSAWMLYEQVLEPALIKIGELWESDHRYVAHEHMLSQAIKSQLAHLLQLLQPPQPRKRIIFACVAHELHDLPLYALALRASHMGCLPIMLGANTPPEALATAVESLAPHGVVLSATTALSLEPIPTHISSNLSAQAKASMGRYESIKQGKGWGTRSDLATNLTTDTTTLKLNASGLKDELLYQEVRAYQQACGETPWLIGGRSINTWKNIPQDLKHHTTSSYTDFDELTL